MNAQTPQQQKSGSPAAAWLTAVLLAAGLVAAGWFVWSRWTADVRQHAGELSLLQERTKQLTATRNRLRELLQVTPCAIPDEVNGLSLLSSAPAAGTTPAKP